MNQIQKQENGLRRCPELAGCVSAGQTQKEALENIREAIELYLEADTIQLAAGAITSEVTLGLVVSDG